MGLRFSHNRAYADCKKTAYPGCCCIQCCGSKFGRESKRNKTKQRIRRYYRHATKYDWKRDNYNEQFYYGGNSWLPIRENDEYSYLIDEDMDWKYEYAEYQEWENYD